MIQISNHFPQCSTFELDPRSGHWYCVVCGADERNVLLEHDIEEMIENDSIGG